MNRATLRYALAITLAGITLALGFASGYAAHALGPRAPATVVSLDVILPCGVPW